MPEIFRRVLRVEAPEVWQLSRASIVSCYVDHCEHRSRLIRCIRHSTMPQSQIPDDDIPPFGAWLLRRPDGMALSKLLARQCVGIATFLTHHDRRVDIKVTPWVYNCCSLQSNCNMSVSPVVAMRDESIHVNRTDNYAACQIITFQSSASLS